MWKAARSLGEPLVDGHRQIAQHARKAIGRDDQCGIGNALVGAYRQRKDVDLLGEKG